MEIIQEEQDLNKLTRIDIRYALEDYIKEYRDKKSKENENYVGDIGLLSADEIVDNMLEDENLINVIKEKGKSFKFMTDEDIKKELENFKNSNEGKKWIKNLKTEIHMNNTGSSTPYKDWGKYKNSRDPKGAADRIMAADKRNHKP
jgi:hypothetical protein